ncbi:hypothetical protein [Sphingobium sp. ZW T5_29]|uniref:hypothetical protein n=1 Tax=Sphingobium sp. ZW T5_29 TaxID=3378077 RepID=UPI003854A779
MTDLNHSSFLTVIEDYLRLTGTCPVVFGNAVSNDGALVADLRHGKQPGHSTVDAVLDYVCDMLSSKLGITAAQA